MRLPGERGAVLTELLMAGAILAVLALMAFPALSGQIGRAHDAVVTHDLRTAATFQAIHLTEHGAYATDEASLVAEGWRKSGGVGEISVDLSGGGYCMQGGSLSGGTLHITSSSGGVRPGAC